MSLATILFFGMPVLLLAVVFACWRQILGNRAARVGVAVMLVPVILFCGFGFLASFEGSDATFVAFRVGYVVVAAMLAAGFGFLAFGRVRERVVVRVMGIDV